MNKEGFLILFFDLKTSNTTKFVYKFKTNVIKNGFIKLQESVYFKYYKNITLSKYTIKTINKYIKQGYDIKFIQLSYKQFLKMNKYSSIAVDLTNIVSNIVIY